MSQSPNKFEQYVGDLTKGGIFCISVLLGLLFISVMLGLVNITSQSFQDFIFADNGQGIWVERDVKVAKDSDSRLDISLSGVASDSSPDAADQRYVPVKHFFSINESTTVEEIEISVSGRSTDNRFHTHHVSIEIEKYGEDFWVANNDLRPANIPVKISNAFFYPFENITLDWSMKFNHLPVLKEVTVYNRSGLFRFVDESKKYDKLSIHDNAIDFMIKLVRPVAERVMFALIVLFAVVHLILVVFILKNKYMFLMSWVAIITFYIGYRILLVPELFSTFIFTDLLFVVVTYLTMVLSLYLIPRIGSPSYNVFVSYRYNDSEFAAGKVLQQLEALMPKQRVKSSRVFFDKKDVEPGEAISDAVISAIAECRAVIVVIGKDWLTMKDSAGNRKIDMCDDYTRLELETAISNGKEIIPILVENADMPKVSQFPENLKGLGDKSGITVRAFGEEFTRDMNKVYKRLQNL